MSKPIITIEIRCDDERDSVIVYDNEDKTTFLPVIGTTGAKVLVNISDLEGKGILLSRAYQQADE